MPTRKAAAPPEGPRKAAQDADVQPLAQPIAQPLAPWLKLVLSALLLFHVIALFWGPFAFACGGSPFADGVQARLRPYTDALYLNHGYFFFAPNPGPSHLVQYKIELTDGRPPITGRFPNLAMQRPRLLYHRHFMLSEALHNRFAPPDPPPEPTPPSLTASPADKARHRREREYYARDLAIWEHQRRQYEAMRRSFEDHLKHEYGGTQVTLTRIEHRPATPDEVRYLGRKINAPETYATLSETSPEEPRQ
jgi:hypothetical protein